MRWLEHRRHGPRDPGEVHLSPSGAALARRVAAATGPFDRVLTSPKPRAVETAEAMGLAVDARLDPLAPVPEPVAGRLDESGAHGCADSVPLVRRGGLVPQVARQQAAFWAEEVRRLPDGASVLMVSHGGLIELGAAAALPDAAGSWGGELAFLEGVRLGLDGERWRSGGVLRVAADV